MLEFVNHFHFIRPAWLLAGPVLIVAFVLIWRQHIRHSSSWQSVMPAHFLMVLGDNASNRKSHLYILLIGLFWLIATLALAGPTWTKKPAPATKEQSALVLVWDLSLSMNAQDLSPSRLQRSKLKLIDLLNRRQEGLTALIVYSGDAHLVTPLTEDTRTIKSLMQSLTPEILPSFGSNIEEATRLAINVLDASTIKNGQIIILTDGIEEEATRELISITKTTRYKMGIWGIGTATGAPIPNTDGNYVRDSRGEIVMASFDEKQLNDIAASINAYYVPFSNSELDLNTIDRYVLSHKEQNTKATSLKSYDQWVEYGPYLLIPALVVFSLLFRRGWILCIVLGGALLQPNVTYAATWIEKKTNLFKTKDQKAMSAFEQNKVEEAAELFTNPDWEAAANYKAKHFDTAERAYRQGNTAESLFNLGNTLAHQQQYEKAIDSYEKALTLDTNLDSAKKNKKLLEDLLKQQEQQQQQQGQDGDKSDQNSDENSSQEQSNNQQDGKSENSKEGNSNQEQSQAGQDKTDDQKGDSTQENNQQNSEQKSDAENEKSIDPNSEKKEASMDDKQKQDLSEFYNQENDPTKQEQEQKQKQKQKNKEAQEQRATDAKKPTEEGSENEQKDAESEQKSAKNYAAIYKNEKELSQDEAELEQWLRKVPDDPGGLLRNKFADQYRQKRAKQWQNRTPPNTVERW